jgi:hypothetical protein
MKTFNFNKKKRFGVIAIVMMLLIQIFNGAIIGIASEDELNSLGVENGKYYNEDKTIVFSEGTVVLDDNEIQSGEVISSEGKHVLEYTSSTGVKSPVIEFTIDKTKPLVEGVISGFDYNTEKKVTFNEGIGKLNDKDFKSGDTVSEDGSYQLIVTDMAGNSVHVDFIIDKTAPVVTGVKDGETYNDTVKILMNEGIGTLNGKTFNSGDTVSEDGEYKLKVIDWAGNKTEINFKINKLGSEASENIINLQIVATDVSPDDEKLMDEITKAIDQKRNPIPGITIEPVVKIDLNDKPDDNINVVLTEKNISDIKDNNLNLEIQTKDANIILDSDVIKKDLGSEDIKEVMITKAHLDKERGEKLTEQVRAENPNSTQFGNVMKFDLSIKDQNDNYRTISDFSEQVTVEMKLSSENLAKIKDKRKVAIYNVLEDGTYVYSGGTLNEDKISFKTEHFSFYIAMESEKSFSDIETSWAKDEIEVLASRNILKGTDENTGRFDAKSKITRGQFAIIISKVMNLKPTKYSVVFNDVKENSYYSNYVLSAYNKQILKGYGESFRPDDFISREQLATVIMTSYKNIVSNHNSQGSGLQKYIDYNKIAEYAQLSVDEISGLGIMQGFPDKSFYPKNNLTREEAAKAIYKFMESAKMI